VRAVNAAPDDGDKALRKMRQHGAIPIELGQLS
jgi:hypothetical protein